MRVLFLKRSLSLLMLLGLTGLAACGRPKPDLIVTANSPHVSPDGRWLLLQASAVRDGGGGWCSVRVDLKSGTRAAPSSLDWHAQARDIPYGWLDDSEFVVSRSRLPATGQTGGTTNYEIWRIRVDGQEHLVRCYRVADSSASLVPPMSCLTLVRRSHMLLFAENKRTGSLPGSAQQRTPSQSVPQISRVIHALDLSNGVDTILGRLPAGWHCMAIHDGRAQAVGGGEILVLADDSTVSTVASRAVIFRLRGGKVERLPIQFATPFVGGAFSSDGAAVAVERKIADERFEIEGADLGPLVSAPRTVATAAQQLWPLWDPSGRRLLLWSILSDDKTRILIVDWPGGKTRAVGLSWRKIYTVCWTPAGDGIYVAAEGALWRVDAASGDVRRVAPFADVFGGEQTGSARGPAPSGKQ
jgi:hypothetical protein